MTSCLPARSVKRGSAAALAAGRGDQGARSGRWARHRVTALGHGARSRRSVTALVTPPATPDASERGMEALTRSCGPLWRAPSESPGPPGRRRPQGTSQSAVRVVGWGGMSHAACPARQGRLPGRAPSPSFQLLLKFGISPLTPARPPPTRVAHVKDYITSIALAEKLRVQVASNLRDRSQIPMRSADTVTVQRADAESGAEASESPCGRARAPGRRPGPTRSQWRK